MLRKPIVWICKRRLDFRHDTIDTHGIYEEPYDDEDDGRMHVIRYKGATKTADNDVGDYTDWQQHRRSTNIHACERRHGRTTTQKQNGNDHQRCEKRVELLKKISYNIRNVQNQILAYCEHDMRRHAKPCFDNLQERTCAVCILLHLRSNHSEENDLHTVKVIASNN